MDPRGDELDVIDRWSARKLQPSVVFNVAGIFAAFMAASHFFFHSPTAVKALAGAGIAAVFQLLLGVINRIEYEGTESGLGKRPLKARKPAPFKEIFRWDELGYVVPTKSGFKYFKTVEEPNPFRRFWKTHLSDTVSGEVHVDTEDRERVLGTLEQKGVPMSKPATERKLGEG